MKKGKIKNEKYKKGLTMTINFFTFIFCIWKGIYFAQKLSFEKCSFATTFQEKTFVVLQDIWNEVMKHQRKYRYALVL